MAATDNNISIPSRMNNRKRDLPPESELISEAKRLFKYDTQSGDLIWVQPKDKRHPGKCVIGSIVGGDDGHGYRVCALLGHKFKVHQVVWMICKNEIPKFPIDHINHNRRDNRIENLRLATDQQNLFNIKTSLNEYSGVRTSKNNFRATIQHNGKKINLGSYKTKDEARFAYIIASRELRGEFSPV